MKMFSLFIDYKMQTINMSNKQSPDISEYGSKQEKMTQINLWASKGKKYGTVSAIQIDKSGGYIRGNQQTQPIWFAMNNFLWKPQLGTAVTYWATHGDGEKLQAVQVETLTDYNNRCNKIRKGNWRHAREIRGGQGTQD